MYTKKEYPVSKTAGYSYLCVRLTAHVSDGTSSLRQVQLPVQEPPGDDVEDDTGDDSPHSRKF